MVPYTSKNARYKKIFNQGAAFYNNNTFYTLDNLVGFIAEFLQERTEELLGKSLVEFELPDRDRGNQDMHMSDREKTTKNLTPRGILVSDFTPVESELADYPTDNNWIGLIGGRPIMLETLRVPKLTDNRVKEWNHFRDLSLTLIGKAKFSSINLFYTVLLDNKIESFDLTKLFNLIFTPDKRINLFQSVKHTVNGLVSADTETKYYTTKVRIPDATIRHLKVVLEIQDKEDSDSILEDIFKLNSSNGLEREIDGSTRKPIWYTRFTSIPMLLPTSIERSDNVKNKSATSAVRMEFQLTYMDVVSFVLNTKYNILSDENPENISKGYREDGQMVSIPVAPVNIAMLPQELGEFVRHDYFTIDYQECDYNEKENICKINLPDLIGDLDYVLKDFILHLHDLNVNEDDYYRIFIKHASGQTDNDTIETSHGTYYSYDDMCCYDTVSKIGGIVHIVIYVDKKKFTKFKYDKGYLGKNNLSVDFMKK